jgi:hypothetical protein
MVLLVPMPTFAKLGASSGRAQARSATSTLVNEIRLEWAHKCLRSLDAVPWVPTNRSPNKHAHELAHGNCSDKLNAKGGTVGQKNKYIDAHIREEWPRAGGDHGSDALATRKGTERADAEHSHSPAIQTPPCLPTPLRHAGHEWMIVSGLSMNAS